MAEQLTLGHPRRLRTGERVVVAALCVLIAAPWLPQSVAVAQATGEAPPSAPVATTPEAPAAATEAPAASTSTEQVFEDPELAGCAPTPTPAAVPTTSAPSDAHARAVLHTRLGRDLRVDDARENVWESTTLATLDASVRRSESLRFALGARVRYHFATLEDDVVDAPAAQHGLDLVPTAAYADAEVAQGMHVQVGYQGVQLGRFDLFSASNVLAVNDLRDGPATLPESATAVGQLAALVDYDVTSAISVRVIYVPFFTPHLMSLTESDYALFPATQADTEEALAMAGEGQPAGTSRRLTRLLREYLSRGDRAQLASGGFSALAPEPTFTHPQAALRVTAHGPAGELAFTAATALEHLPALALSQSMVDYLFSPDDLGAQGSLAASSRPLSIRHGRFFVLSADGAMDVGPFSLGAEAAFMKDRALYAMREAGDAEGVPGPGEVDLAHLGLRGEWLSGTEWLVVLEAFAAYALNEPNDSVCKRPRGQTVNSECTWMLLEGGRLLRGVAALASFAPSELGLHFELGGGLLSGPSVAFMPRIAYDVLDTLEVEVGALVISGKRAPSTLTPSVALGGMYEDVDQFFVGVRYLP